LERLAGLSKHHQPIVAADHQFGMEPTGCTLSECAERGIRTFG
jgi:hypothetical protein